MLLDYRVTLIIFTYMLTVPHKRVGLEGMLDCGGFTLGMSAMYIAVVFLCISAGVKRYIKPDPFKSNGSACD